MSKMKVLTLMGSERLNNNTHNSINLFLKSQKLENEEIYSYNIKELNFRECISCYGCAKSPACVLKDDLTHIYKLIEEVDLIIFATPIYFNSLSAIAKKLVDRMQVYWSRKFVLKLPPIKEKRGIAIINGGISEKSNQFLGSELVFDHFFKFTNCKNNIYIEVSNTDDNPINEENKEFMKLLDEIEIDNNKYKKYIISGSNLKYEN